MTLPALDDVRTVLVDSLVALEHAWARGLPRAALVRTSSPGLLAAGVGARPLDEDLPPDGLERLDRDTLPFTSALYDAVRYRHGDAEALTVARMGLRFQTTVYKAMALGPGDFSGPLAIVRWGVPDPDLDRRLNPPWEALLAAHPNLHLIETPESLLPSTVRSSRAAVPGLAARLRFEDWQSVLGRLAWQTWDRLPPLSRRGVALVRSSNTVVKEIAAQLSLRGFEVRTLPVPEITPGPPGPTPAQLAATCRPALEAHLGGRLAAPVVDPAIALFASHAADAVSRGRAALPAWRDRVRALAGTRPALVLANYPFGPEDIALHDACRELGVPLVASQHGISPEISARHDHAQVYFENNNADLLLVYNDEAAARYTDHNRFPHADTRTVGLPADYRAVQRRRAARATEPVLYVSLALYMGNEQIVQVGGPDRRKAEFDLLMIDRVLSRLPHGVLFKPYPDNNRYADVDPVLQRARAAPNVRCFEDGVDLRYLLADARVLVTSHATSTLGWCLAADRPLVFVDIPDLLPLRTEARAALQESIFVFDGADPEVHERLRKFLSQPLERIEHEWALRADARRAAVRRFVGETLPGAGRSAVRPLMALAQPVGGTHR